MTGIDWFLIIIAIGFATKWAIEAWRDVPHVKTREEIISDLHEELDELYDDLSTELDYDDNEEDIDCIKSKIHIREESLRALLEG
jgi:hypothetical protein